MSFLGFYKIRGLHRNYFKTAKQLYRRVLKDSEFKQEWIASYAELVRVCQKQKFPKKYANEIMICILNASSNPNSKTKKRSSVAELSADERAEYFCFNYLKKATDEKAISARERYFSSILDDLIDKGPKGIRFVILRDKIYDELCDEWKKSMMNMFYNNELLNIGNIKKLLEMEFYNTIINAKNKRIIVTGRRKNNAEFINCANRGKNKEAR